LISESGSFSVRSRSAAQPDRRQIRMHDRQRPGVVVDLVDCAHQRLFVLNDEPEQGQRTGSSTSSRKGRHQPTKDPDRAGQIAGSTGVPRRLGRPSRGVLDLNGGCKPFGA
jgi:hypothetical protein